MRIHVVDGTFELYRAHFSPRPRVLFQERDVTASLGVVSSLAALLHEPEERATHLAIAFDNPIRSFRNDLYAGYKTDEGVPPELRAQFDLVEEACRAAGFVVWSMRDLEADDALFTAARKFAALAEVSQVCICSPDKDLGQALSGTRVVQLDRIRKRRITEESFRAARGFAPASMPDFLALTGDAADGFPGLAGFGEKTAGALVAEYAHLEALVDHADDWVTRVRGGPRLRDTLLRHKDDALLFRTLATLRYDANLAEDVGALAYEGPRDAAFLERLGGKKLLSRLQSAGSSSDAKGIG